MSWPFLDNLFNLRRKSLYKDIGNFLKVFGFLGHLSHSRDLLQMVFVRRRPLSVVHRQLTI